jgi:hypothetical protein
MTQGSIFFPLASLVFPLRPLRLLLLSGLVTNLKSGNSLPARTIPPQLLKIVEAGGIFPLLEKEGYIAPMV